ncbi:MAG: hypothetical protein OXJ36_03850 [bacterium]|nr:hypothetical protein [bacterium]
MGSFSDRLANLDYGESDSDEGQPGREASPSVPLGRTPWIAVALLAAISLCALWWFWDPIWTFLVDVLTWIAKMVLFAVVGVLGVVVFVKLFLPWLIAEVKRAIGPI